ncbi:MAG: peptidylprolyl isomerase [Candidatus Omnitrophota bacterium]
MINLRARKAPIAGLFVVFLAISLFSLGCEQIPFLSDLFPKKKTPGTTFKIDGTLLVRINNWGMSLEEFNERIANLEQLIPEFKIQSVDDKRAILDEFLRQQLLVQEAKRRGLDKKKEIMDASGEFMNGLLVREIITQETENVTVSSKEIEDYYNIMKQRFTELTQYRIREIVADTESQANQILIEILRGSDFASTARQYSKSETASNGGDLGYIDSPKFPKFDIAVASLEIGKVSNVFKGEDGYYIIKLEGKKGGKQKSLSEAWDEIKAELTMLKQNQKIQELTEKLRQQADIELHDQLLR